MEFFYLHMNRQTREKINNQRCAVKKRRMILTMNLLLAENKKKYRTTKRRLANCLTKRALNFLELIATQISGSIHESWDICIERDLKKGKTLTGLILYQKIFKNFDIDFLDSFLCSF